MINEETQLDSALQLKIRTRHRLSRVSGYSAPPGKFNSNRQNSGWKDSHRYLHWSAKSWISISRAFGNSLERLKRFKSCSTHFTSKQMLTKAFTNWKTKRCSTVICTCTSIFTLAIKEWAEQGVRWIISYFPFDRNEPPTGRVRTSSSLGLCRKFNCYDGVVKSVKACQSMQKYESFGLRAKLQQG